MTDRILGEIHVQSKVPSRRSRNIMAGDVPGARRIVRKPQVADAARHHHHPCRNRAAGAFRQPPGVPAGQANARFDDVPAFCRVAATLAPSKDSDIKIEVWLPASGWNGKFQAVGNGGWSGSIVYPSLGRAGGARLRHRQHRHRARRRQRQLRARASGEADRFRLSRRPRDDRQGQGHRRGLLRRRRRSCPIGTAAPPAASRG